MAATGLKRSGAIAYRQAVPQEQTGDPVMLVHGFPESSLMWEATIAALTEAGRRCIAPDLYCLGDSTDEGPATFERNLEALTHLHAELDLGRVALVVHDWGGFIGLAWACEHPDLVAGLVISDTGFFSDGRWHGLAEAVRAPGGEELLAALDRNGFAGLLRGDGAEFDDDEIDAYWRPFAEGRGREATVEFYRSMDFAKLERYDGALGALGAPTLLLWGAEDRFAPVGGAYRFQKEIPGSELIAIEGAGHFVFDQERERCPAEVVAFLTRAEDLG